MSLIGRYIFSLILLLNPATVSSADRAPLIVPLAIYIIDADDGSVSSQRSVQALRAEYDQVNAVWSRAQIQFRITRILRLPIPAAIANAIPEGQFWPLQLHTKHGASFDDDALLRGFYSNGIGGANGMALLPSNIYLVTDNPSVPRHRVAAHELGHLLGLGHEYHEPDRLMYRATDGTRLIHSEIEQVRVLARQLLNQARTIRPGQ